MFLWHTVLSYVIHSNIRKIRAVFQLAGKNDLLNTLCMYFSGEAQPKPISMFTHKSGNTSIHLVSNSVGDIMNGQTAYIRFNKVSQRSFFASNEKWGQFCSCFKLWVNGKIFLKCCTHHNTC